VKADRATFTLAWVDSAQTVFVPGPVRVCP